VAARESILFNYGRNAAEEDAIDLGSSICSRDAGMCLTDAGQFINRISGGGIDGLNPTSINEQYRKRTDSAKTVD